MGPMNTSNVARAVRSDDFHPIAGFGPELDGGLMHTFEMPVGIGNLTATASPELRTAPRLSLFVPGFSGSKEDFSELFPQLYAKLDDPAERALASFSLRGQADSVAPAGQGAYRLEDFVADGCRVMEQLATSEYPIDLVGHSFGGVVARRMTIARPDLVRSLTLFSTGAVPIGQSEITRSAKALIEQYGTMVVFKGNFPDCSDEPQDDPYTEMCRLRAHATSIDNLLAMSDILIHYNDVTNALKDTGVPVSIVYGANDLVWPQPVYVAEAKALGVTPTVIADAGHSGQLDNPEALATALVNFWDHCDE